MKKVRNYVRKQEWVLAVGSALNRTRYYLRRLRLSSSRRRMRRPRLLQKLRASDEKLQSRTRQVKELRTRLASQRQANKQLGKENRRLKALMRRSALSTRNGMPVVLLVHGRPRQGKSYVALRLRDQYSFTYVDVDGTYVEFIKLKCPFLFFDDLENHIGTYYRDFFSREYMRRYWVARLGRDLVSEWHSYLRTTIEEHTVRWGNVVVDGYLLYDCMDDLQANLKSIAKIYQVEVRDKLLFLTGLPVTLEDIASLSAT